MSESRHKRVLLVTRNLPPLLGGMERLNWHIAEQLSRIADVQIVGPSGAARLAPIGIEVSEVSLKPLPWFLANALYRAIVACKRWQPDIVLAGSGLTAPLAWIASRLTGTTAAVYLHGLDIGIRHPIYRWLWIPSIKRADVVIANSYATRLLAIKAGVEPARIVVVHPGVDPPSPRIDKSASEKVRSRYHLGEGPILLSVGRLTERKGMREFVANVLPGIVAYSPDVSLLIVGEAPTQSLGAKTQSRASIEAVATTAGVASNVRFSGPITDRNLLDDIYRTANAHVFPVRQITGDPEGFGMVAIEAAAHGLATVAYATGGIVDAVAHGRSGYLVPPGDDEAFVKATCALLDAPIPTHTIRDHASEFSWDKFGERIRAALKV